MRSLITTPYRTVLWSYPPRVNNKEDICIQIRIPTINDKIVPIAHKEVRDVARLTVQHTMSLEMLSYVEHPYTERRLIALLGIRVD